MLLVTIVVLPKYKTRIASLAPNLIPLLQSDIWVPGSGSPPPKYNRSSSPKWSPSVCRDQVIYLVTTQTAI